MSVIEPSGILLFLRMTVLTLIKVSLHMPSPLFDRRAVKVQPLSDRQHDLDLSAIRNLDASPESEINPKMHSVAGRILRARKSRSAVLLMMGGHVIRSGVQRYLVDLMRRGYIGCLAFNGSGIVHDYEFARIGATTESVARYIKTGEFGMWLETGFLNDVINQAYQADKSVGMGEAVGRAIEDQGLPHKDISLLAAAYRFGIPATIHVGIGYDIIHQHPNCDGAATGALSYNDFLKFAGVMQSLEKGVVMNFGSGVMAPEVYLKSLSMARNVARQQQKEIRDFTTLVCDLHDLPEDFSAEPPKSSAAYYFRPWKTMLVRTVADGGESFYIQGSHGSTIPSLWSAINIGEKNSAELSTEKR
jgi:hypothetical protein